MQLEPIAVQHKTNQNMILFHQEGKIEYCHITPQSSLYHGNKLIQKPPLLQQWNTTEPPPKHKCIVTRFAGKLGYKALFSSLYSTLYMGKYVSMLSALLSSPLPPKSPNSKHKIVSEMFSFLTI